MRNKPDPYQTTAELIANAITTARVMGESPRITRLVASSIGRFAAELEGAAPEGLAPGHALLQFALASISEADTPLVPKLHGNLSRMLRGDGGIDTSSTQSPVNP